MRKTWRYLLLATMLISLLAGCAQPGGDASGKKGGSLIVGFYQEPENLNINIATQTVASEVNEFFNDALLNIDENGEYVAELAKEVPSVQNGGISEDGLTITYNLIDGIKWSDGEDCDCDDWVFTWNVIMTPDSGVKSTTGWKDLESVTCPDKKTVVFKFTKYYAPHLQSIGTAWILPEHATGDPSGMQSWAYNQMPVGNGPWKVSEWVSGDHITLVPNEHYYKKGMPYMDQVIAKVIPSREVGKQLIGTGEIDILWDLVEADIPEFESKEGVVLSAPADTGTERLIFNLRDPDEDAPCADKLEADGLWHWALGDVRVRQAIRYGIDKATINDKLLYGKATLGTAEINMGWAKPDIPVSEFSVDKAKELLDEAGWKDGDGDGIRECDGCMYADKGRALRLKLQTTSGNKLREQTEQVLIEMMQDIGVEFYIENVPSSELFASYSSGAFRKHGQFDILMYTSSFGPDPQSQVEGYYASFNVPCDDNNGKGYNYHRWVNKEYDELMKTAGSSPDLEVRKDAYQKASALIDAEVPAIYLYDRLELNAYRDSLQGWVPNNWAGMGWNSDAWWIKTE